MFENRTNALEEIGHETGVVIIASVLRVGKDGIPKVDGMGMNQKIPLTHLVDYYTFGQSDPAPGLPRWKTNPSPHSVEVLSLQIPKVKVVKRFTKKMLDENPDMAFLFGDNEERTGTGGQAKVCRGQKNAYGIRTKQSPSMSKNAFWSDKNYKSNINMMADDFMAAFRAGHSTLVLPADGIGTGMADLKNKAPKTFKWLRSMMKQLAAWEE